MVNMQLDNYHMKMAVFEELKNALQVKRINDELLEYLISSLNWLLRYEKKYGLELPERDKITDMLNKIIAVIGKTPITQLSDESLQRDKSNKNDDNLTEPYALISGLLFSTALRKTDSKKRESSKLFISILLD